MRIQAYDIPCSSYVGQWGQVVALHRDQLSPCTQVRCALESFQRGRGSTARTKHECTYCGPDSPFYYVTHGACSRSDMVYNFPEDSRCAETRVVPTASCKTIATRAHTATPSQTWPRRSTAKRRLPSTPKTARPAGRAATRPTWAPMLNLLISSQGSTRDSRFFAKGRSALGVSMTIPCELRPCSATSELQENPAPLKSRLRPVRARRRRCFS